MTAFCLYFLKSKLRLKLGQLFSNWTQDSITISFPSEKFPSLLITMIFTCYGHIWKWYMLFFRSNAFFFQRSLCPLTFSWILLQVLLRCCLVHTAITILKHILYLVYSYLCLGLGLSYLCNLFFIFSLVFIVINHITSFKQTYLFFALFFTFFRMSLIIFGWWRRWRKWIIFK